MTEEKAEMLARESLDAMINTNKLLISLVKVNAYILKCLEEIQSDVNDIKSDVDNIDRRQM